MERVNKCTSNKFSTLMCLMMKNILTTETELPTRLARKGAGESGDPLMPLLFSVRQHDALSAMSDCFAYLDDIWLVSKPEMVGDLHSSAERELWIRARTRIHSGKTRCHIAIVVGRLWFEECGAPIGQVGLTSSMRGTPL